MKEKSKGTRAKRKKKVENDINPIMTSDNNNNSKNMKENSETGVYDYYCDKCGGIFSSDYELDHHDKTDH